MGRLYRITAACGLAIVVALAVQAGAKAAAPAAENPQSGSVGLQGKVSSPPPTQAATISVPVNGASFTTLPITVSGLCKAGLLVKIFDNNVFVGAVVCENGSYSLSIDLFVGQNDLIARVYDNLDQAGPDSNKVSVSFNISQAGQLAQFPSRVNLTSLYARRGANPGDDLSWPIIISGGTGPYAISVDWGDGTPLSLISVLTAGSFNIDHTYKSAGQYVVVVKATDKNGTTAYLQLVGVANGQIGQASGTSNSNTTSKTVLIWWPAILIAPFAVASFYLGRRHQLFVLRRSIERQQ